MGKAEEVERAYPDVTYDQIATYANDIIGGKVIYDIIIHTGDGEPYVEVAFYNTVDGCISIDSYDILLSEVS